jgi:hypothetical protein
MYWKRIFETIILYSFLFNISFLFTSTKFWNLQVIALGFKYNVGIHVCVWDVIDSHTDRHWIHKAG